MSNRFRALIITTGLHGRDEFWRSGCDGWRQALVRSATDRSPHQLEPTGSWA